MMRIFMLFEDKGIFGVKLDKPSDGNPGIGGTQYLFLALAEELATNEKNEVTLLHYNEAALPEDVHSIIIQADIFEILEENQPDLFIFHPNKDAGWYNRINKTGVKSIAWVHNFISYSDASVIAESDNIVAVVFVGKQQYDRYIDHSIARKATYIYNFVAHSNTTRSDDYKNYVTYVGSLTPSKGFHWLAHIWKNVLKRIPDAELHVVGTGKLYDRTCKLGKYGIAEESYEQYFIKEITDAEGVILSSVIFHGNMGCEKEELFRYTAVGIMNPSGATETFGLSAVEMERVGVPVISRKRYGLLDTIADGKTGILINSERELEDAIILLLEDKESNRIYGNNARTYVKEKFDRCEIVNEWEKLFEELYVGGYQNKVSVPNDFLLVDLKWARVINLFLKKIPLFKQLPSIGEMSEYIKRLI